MQQGEQKEGVLGRCCRGNSSSNVRVQLLPIVSTTHNMHAAICILLLQRYVKCPMELQALQLEIVISEETERETQRQALKVCLRWLGCVLSMCVGCCRVCGHALNDGVVFPRGLCWGEGGCLDALSMHQLQQRDGRIATATPD